MGVEVVGVEFCLVGREEVGVGFFEEGSLCHVMGLGQNRRPVNGMRKREVGALSKKKMCVFLRFGRCVDGEVRVGRVRRFRFGRVRGARCRRLGRWPAVRWRWICGIFCGGLGFGRFPKRFWLGARLEGARREVESGWRGRKEFGRRGDSGLGLAVGVGELGVVWLRPRRRRGC